MSYTCHDWGKKKINTPYKKSWLRPGSNRGPSACKADVITTTLRNHLASQKEILLYKQFRLTLIGTPVNLNLLSNTTFQCLELVPWIRKMTIHFRQNGNAKTAHTFFMHATNKQEQHKTRTNQTFLTE